MSLNPLRNLPSVHEVLESAPVRRLLGRLHAGAVLSTVRTVLEEVRHEVQNAATEVALPSVTELAERIAQRVAESEEAPAGPVINATGILLHPKFGPAPLAEEAVAEMAAAASDYTQSPAAGVVLPGGDSIEGLLRELTGAEAAFLTNSVGSAALLALAAIGGGREVVVARGDVGEFGERCSLPELAAAAGCSLREVGTFPHARLDDYLAAVGDRTAAFLLVPPADYAVVGGSERPSLEELANAADARQLVVVHGLALGTLVDSIEFGLNSGMTLSESVQAGAGIVVTRGDGLLGGPPCGILLGRGPLIDRISRHPLARSLEAGRMTQAALRATLRLYREPEKAKQSIPLLRLLKTSVANLQNRAERLAPQMAASAMIAGATPIASTSDVAGHGLPGQQLPTWCIALEPKVTSVERLAAALRQTSPPVIGRADQERLLMDLRSVMPRQDQQLAPAVCGMS